MSDFINADKINFNHEVTNLDGVSNYSLYEEMVGTEYNSLMVLCIEEREFIGNSIDTRLFIVYDHENNTFIILGKRSATERIDPEPYKFNYKYKNDLYEFIKVILNDNVNIIMYNFTSLESNTIDYNYYLFETKMNEKDEITARDSVSLRNNKIIVNCLDSLKKSFNFDRNMCIF